MKQGILPLIPAGASAISEVYSVFRGATDVTWFSGQYPMRVHAANDHRTQRAMMAFIHHHGGVSQAQIAAALGVHPNTVLAAERVFGNACTRVTERALAACGLLTGVKTRFETCLDVAQGGVLCAIPALVANGLFAHLALWKPMQKGYYQLIHLLLLLSVMARLRVRTVESLRRETPGEIGKILGLDRIPEVRYVRGKLGLLATDAVAVQR